ncbi:GTPase Era [Enorma burkinafasonensis]|uniref:GTPase Era n=1 Tax=Enorma burkinafasonensis TaxID=2590867 RepID=UPI0026EE12D0|nr:GTPase Era [Enorma burkinafasonensis]MCI7731025.1 GTPase Era [Enorma burkinafasonensis]
MTDIVENDPFAGLSDEELDALAESAPADAASGAPSGLRSGFVALVGRPNAGKSTLMNACMGTKMAITSPVAQTTRRRMCGVVRREGLQIVFIDTPGIHKPQDSLGSELNKSALSELSDVDVLCFLIDASKPVGKGDAWIAERVAKSPAKRILVLTKADLASPELVAKQVEAARELVAFDDVIVLSATEGFNVDGFIDLVASYLPEGPEWFPEGMATDIPDETVVAEFVREKVLLRTREEVPHSVGVVCDEFERKRDLLRLHCTIYVERDGQKGIIIGKKGALLKAIGTDARRDLEQIFGCRVYLELDVRVQKNWRTDVREIRRLGYSADD